MTYHHRSGVRDGPPDRKEDEPCPICEQPVPSRRERAVCIECDRRHRVIRAHDVQGDEVGHLIYHVARVLHDSKGKDVSLLRDDPEEVSEMMKVMFDADLSPGEITDWLDEMEPDDGSQLVFA